MNRIGLGLGCLVLLASGIAAQEADKPTMTLDDLVQLFSWDFDQPIQTEVVDEGLIVLFGIGGNIVASIGEDGVLIVDDQFPQMIPKVNLAIAEHGGGAVDFAINTHWHFDHADGNIALGPAGTWIVAQEQSTEMMAKDNLINLVMTNYKQDAYPPDARPVISFGERMTMHFNGGDIEIFHVGPAHTTGDAVVIFRKHNAIHFGDVFNNTGYPFIDADNGGSIDGMIRFCQVVLSKLDENTTIIPGHGPVTDMATVEAYVDMLISVRNSVKDLIDQGMTLEQVVAANVTADFDATYGALAGPSGFIDRVYTSLSK